MNRIQTKISNVIWLDIALVVNNFGLRQLKSPESKVLNKVRNITNIQGRTKIRI